MASRTRSARRILGIMKKSVSWVEACVGRRRLTFACSRRPWAGATRDGVGGRWKSQKRKNVYLSPYVHFTHNRIWIWYTSILSLAMPFYYHAKRFYLIFLNTLEVVLFTVLLGPFLILVLLVDPVVFLFVISFLCFCWEYSSQHSVLYKPLLYRCIFRFRNRKANLWP